MFLYNIKTIKIYFKNLISKLSFKILKLNLKQTLFYGFLKIFTKVILLPVILLPVTLLSVITLEDY